MLKVFLAEDEIVMREGIKNNIDWQGEGFEFVGDAATGTRLSDHPEDETGYSGSRTLRCRSWMDWS